MLLKECWWRVRCAVVFWRRLRCSPLFAWQSAWAGDYWPDYTPTESVDEELTYWIE
jgi:hypothetical protein